MRDHVRISLRCAVVLPVLALAGCNDDGVSPAAGCQELQQTSASAAGSPLGEKGRIRFNLVSRLGTATGSGESLRTAGIELRQNGRCLRLTHAASTRLESVEGMTGAAVADVLLDAGTISEILITTPEQKDDRPLAAERLRLRTPIQVEAGKRTEVFIALDSLAGKKEVAPRFIAAGPVPLNASTVLVAEPGRKGALSLKGGFSMDWPDDALKEAAVYGIVENDVGGVTPAFSVMPAGKLDHSVRITLPLDRSRIPQGLSMSDYDVSLAGSTVASTVKGNSVTFNALGTGPLGMGTNQPYVELDDGTRIASPFAGSAGAARSPNGTLAARSLETCYQRLSANRSSYLQRLANGSAGVRVTDCETLPPYVHIVIVNIAYTKPTGYNYPRVVLPAEWYSGTNTFLLHTISEHANLVSGSFAVINGFLWDGDSGSSTGTGTPKGTLYISGARKSPAYTGAEALIGFTIPYTTGTFTSFFSKPSGTSSIDLGTYNYNVVPSTTSIVKNGACSGEGRSDRWSSIGIGNGLLVMVSSISGESTYDTDLCTVYQGLNVMGGAIRLDGGPSAALSWLGTHLNPLTGLDSYYYGSARHVAYGVGAIY